MGRLLKRATQGPRGEPFVVEFLETLERVKVIQ